VKRLKPVLKCIVITGAEPDEQAYLKAQELDNVEQIFKKPIDLLRFQQWLEERFPEPTLSAEAEPIEASE